MYSSLPSIISCFTLSSSFLISSIISSLSLSRSPDDAPPPLDDSPRPLTLGVLPSSEVEPNLFREGLGDSGPVLPFVEEVFPGLFCDDLGGSCGRLIYLCVFPTPTQGSLELKSISVFVCIRYYLYTDNLNLN